MIKYTIPVISGFISTTLILIMSIVIASLTGVVDKERYEIISLKAKLETYDAKYFLNNKEFDSNFNNLRMTAENEDYDLVKTDGSTSKNTMFNTDIEIPELEHTGVNENYIGRLSIPKLGIEDALYFSGDDYYLKINRNDKADKAGELYIDGRSPGDLFKMDNLINGHSMKNGTKFGKLLTINNYDSQIHIFIDDYKTGRVLVYEVFSTNLISNDTSGVYLTFNSLYERNMYYQKLKETSKYESNQKDFSNNILMLNTCDNNIKDGHLIVSAVLVGWR